MRDLPWIGCAISVEYAFDYRPHGQVYFSKTIILASENDPAVNR